MPVERLEHEREAIRKPRLARPRTDLSFGWERHLHEHAFPTPAAVSRRPQVRGPQVSTCTQDSIVVLFCVQVLTCSKSTTSRMRLMELVPIAYRPKALAEIEAAIVASFEHGSERVVLDLDSLETLDSEGVRGLIVLLRRARVLGIELALHVTRPEIRRTLSVMALDRLFPMTTKEVAA
ncbi:MAG: STAS domain-containing protein [Vulcanimicrobiaceae bacterium]